MFDERTSIYTDNEWSSQQLQVEDAQGPFHSTNIFDQGMSLLFEAFVLLEVPNLSKNLSDEKHKLQQLQVKSSQGP